MKKQITKWSFTVLFFFQILFGNFSFAQNAIVGTGFSTGWDDGTCNNTSNFKYLNSSTGTSYALITNANAVGNSFFRLAVDWSGSRYSVSGAGAVGVSNAVLPNTTYTVNGACDVTGTMMYDVPNTSFNYIFKTSAAGASVGGNGFVFFEVQGAVRSVSSVSQSPIAGSVISGPVAVNATLDGALSAGQAVYLRYTNNAYSTSTVVQMTGSGTAYSASIPGNLVGANVSYYVFTSGTASVATNGSNADLYSINLNNNAGANYTYTVGGANVIVTNPTNTTPNLAATYSTLAAAITALNATTVISGPVTITLGANETAPTGGYSITAAPTGASNINRITIQGSGAMITAFTPQVSGTLTDAIFKIVGADFITIQNFTMQENAANTTTAAATNNMTEFGVALLYASTTNGAQNNIIQNNTISLNRTYQNTFGIYSNSTHSATNATTSATATTTAGSNSELKIYGNAISNINQGISIVGPTASANHNTGIDVGGTTVSQGNTITNWGTTGTFSAYANVSGTLNGILVRNSAGYNISYNTVTSSAGGNTGTLSQRAIFVPAFSNAPTTAVTCIINNNNISVQSGITTGTVNGIIVETTTGSATSSLTMNANNFSTMGHTIASPSGAHTYISNAMAHLNTTISNNTFTNLAPTTTGSVTFIANAISVPAASGSMNINSNSIVTAFNKTGAGGTVTFYTSNASSLTGSTINFQNNNISNITVSGAAGFVGINNTDGGSPTKTITGNTFNNISGGTGAINPITINFMGATSSVSNNTVSNITWGAACAGITIGTSSATATTLNVNNNTVSNITLSSGAVTGITIAQPLTTTLNVNGNTISGLSSTAGVAVQGLLVTGAATPANIFSNTIFNLSGSNAGATIVGIGVSAGASPNIFANKIYDCNISGASTAVPAVTGLLLSGSTSITVQAYNNLIGDLRAATANSADAIRGIAVTSTATASNYRLYNNTIYLNANSSGAVFGTTGIFHTVNATATTAALDLKNNMVFNTSTPNGAGVVTATRRSAAATLGNYASSSNNNLYFAGTPGTNRAIMTDGTNVYQTMATFQTAVGPTRETASFSESTFVPGIYFTSTAGSNASYLKPATGLTTQSESGGQTITLTSPDYGSVVRPASSGTNFDCGAWEFAGNSPAPAITLTSVTPATTVQCTKVARAVIVAITTPAGTVTGANLNYSHNGTAQTAIVMTNTFGSTWTGTMLAPTIGNANVTWTVVATNSIGISTTYTGTAFADEPLTGATATATATPSTVCAGSSTSLSVLVNKSGNVIIGTQTSAALTGGPYRGGNCTANKVQYLITSAELTAAGIYAGNINSLTFITTSTGGALPNFSINIAHSSLNTLTTTLESTGFTQVFSIASFTPALGNNLHTFSTPFNWNGTSNIIVNVCHDYACNTSATMQLATTSFNGSSFLLSGASGSNCTTYTGATIAATRPVMIFGANTVNPSAYSWSDGSTVVGTTNPLNQSPSVNTSFTTTATVSGCPLVSNTTAVTITALPSAPTANVASSAQCGSGVPTVSVSGTAGQMRWYDGNTSGAILLQTGGLTFASPITSTQTLYVAVNNGTCETAPSNRTPLVITVSAADALTASVSPVGNICLGNSIDLSVAQTGSNQSYTLTWTASPAAGSGIPTPIAGSLGSALTVTPTTAGTYIFTITGVDGTCTNFSTVSVTVINPNVGVTATATAAPSTICAGSPASLSVVIEKSGTALLGSGTGNSSSSPTPFSGAYGGIKGQYIILGSELTSAGLSAGNITSIGINFLSAVTATYSGLTIQLGTTGLSAFPATLSLESTGLSTCYGPTNFVNPTAGVNTFTLSTPFTWNGTSNIIISTNWSNNTTTSTAASVITTTTAFNSAQTHKRDSYTPVTLLALTGAQSGGSSVVGNTRPNFTIVGNTASTPSAYTWSDGSTVVGTINPSSQSPSANTTYTATAIVSGCPVVSNAVGVTVTALPSAPTANVASSTQCGSGVPTVSVSGTAGQMRWYDGNTSGAILLQTGGLTFASPITSTQTLYVAVNNGTCETAPSNRTPLVITVSAADALTASVSPVGNICLGNSIDLSVAQTGSNQSYTLTWTASPAAGSGIPTPIAGSLGSALTVTPTTAGTYIFTITGVDGTCTNFSTVSVTVINPNVGVTAAATAAPSTICAGSPTSLDVAFFGPGSRVVSTSLAATTAASYSNPLYSNWANNRSQILILGSELTASGISAGNITSMSIPLTATSLTTRTGYTISIGSTGTSALTTTSFLAPTFTTVYSANYTPFVGTNTFTFTTPFVWDGSSNIVIETCWDNTASTATVNSTATSQTTSFNSVISYNRTTTTGVSICGAANAPLLAYTNRPLITFVGSNVSINPAVSAYSWSDGSTVVGTTNPLSQSPTVSTTYTATATINGCPIISNNALVTVNPLPSAPTVANSSQCGSQIPTASVSDGNGFVTPTFNWYAANVGGVALQSTTSTTYGTIISVTTTFYVSVTNPTTGCESLRTPITVNVTPAPTFTLSASSDANCSGASTASSITITSGASDYDTFTWSPNPLTVAGNPTTGWTFSPIVSTVYTLVASQSAGACASTASVNITTTPASVGGTATASISQLCFSGISDLSLAGNTGVIQWQSSPDNSVWSDVASGGTSATYSTPTLTSTTYYRANVTNSICASAQSNVLTVTVNNPAVLTNTPATICGAGTATLGASASSGSTLNWYAAASGGSAIGTGTSFTTPSISTTTNYFVSASTTPSVVAGARTSPASTTSTGAFTYGLVFDVTSQFTLNSVDVYNAGSAGTMVVQLQNSAGTVLQTLTSPSIPAGTGTVATAVNLGWTIPVGSGYRLLAISSPSLVRESALGGFPYALSTIGSITSGYISGTNTAYYYFYNWNMSVACESARTQVTATVNTAPAFTLSSTASSICSASSTATPITIASGSADYDIYTWSPATGVTGDNLTGWNFNPSTTTNYTLNVSQSAGICINSAPVLLTVNELPSSVTAASSIGTICNGATVDLTSSANSNYAPIVTLLSPTGDGGFETSASNFPSNGWSIASQAQNAWFNGSAVVNSGSRAAYITTTGSAGAAATYNKGTTRVSHLYRDVIIPVGATNISLSFNWQGVGEVSAGGIYYDFLTVSMIPTSTVPVAATTLVTGALATNLNNQSTWQFLSIPISSAVAGTTQRFVFTWQNDASGGTDPSGAIDNVSITANVPEPATFTWTASPAGFTSSVQNPTGVAPTANTTYTVEATNGYNCKASNTVAVVVNPVPSSTITSTSTNVCYGNDYVIEGNIVASGAWTLTLSNGATTTGTGSGTWSSTVLPTATTTYSVTNIVDVIGCPVGTLSGNTVLTLPTATTSLSPSDNATCVVKGTNWIHFYSASGRLIVSINPNGNDLGNVTAASFVDGTPVFTQACGTDVNPNYTSATLARRWVITPTNNLAALVRFPFEDAEFGDLVTAAGTTANGFDDVFAISDLQMSKYNGTSEDGDWSNNCGTGSSANFIQTANGSITTANSFVSTIASTSFVEFSIPGFSEFWLFNSGEPSALPVEVVSFVANCNSKEVDVKWTTASEQNSQNFIIENSRDLSNWITVGEVDAAGNSNQSIDYSIIDENPIAGISYYRMKQVDLNGAQRIYGPISVSCSDTENSMVVFPNPTKGSFTVEISSYENYSNAQIQITDLTGKVINARSTNILEGKNQFTFEDLDLQLGTYIINLNTGNGKINPVRVVVN